MHRWRVRDEWLHALWTYVSPIPVPHVFSYTDTIKADQAEPVDLGLHFHYAFAPTVVNHRKSCFPFVFPAGARYARRA